MSMVNQVLSLFAAKNGFLDEIEVENVRDFEKSMLRYFHEKNESLLNEIEKTGDLSDELQEKLKEEMRTALEEFKLVKGA